MCTVSYFTLTQEMPGKSFFSLLWGTKILGQNKLSGCDKYKRKTLTPTPLQLIFFQGLEVLIQNELKYHSCINIDLVLLLSIEKVTPKWNAFGQTANEIICGNYLWIGKQNLDLKYLKYAEL